MRLAAVDPEALRTSFMEGAMTRTWRHNARREGRHPDGRPGQMAHPDAERRPPDVVARHSQAPRMAGLNRGFATIMADAPLRRNAPKTNPDGAGTIRAGPKLV